MLEWWRQCRVPFWLSTAYFIASCLFFHVVTALTLGDWSIGLLSESSCVWDCKWYASIVDLDYMTERSVFPENNDMANWAFFPAFPLAAKGVQLLLGTPTWAALLITSKLFLWSAIFLFVLAATKRFGTQAGPLAATLVAFNPYLVYGHVGYTESLFFTLTVLGFLLLWQDKWLATGWITAVLSATRLVGGGMIFALLFAQIRKRAFSGSWEQKSWAGLALFLCPLGAALFVAHLHFRMGDALAFMNVQIAWGRSFQIPLDALICALLRFNNDTYFGLCAIAGLAMVVWLYRRQQVEEALFLGISIMIPLMSNVMSMPRYVFWQFPFLWGVLQLSFRYPLFKKVYLSASVAMAIAMVALWYCDNVFVV
jgi:hypothetical protein